jgi:hypothetical protein
MAVAFFTTLGLTVSAVAAFRTPHNPLGVALMTSARIAFLFFWPAYMAGVLTSIFGDFFLPVRQHARNLGLAFAAALLVHLGFVAYLSVSGRAPPWRVFVIFGTAAILTYLLAFLSIDRVRQAFPAWAWQLIRLIAMNYIALAFISDFAKFSFTNLADGLLYLPFAVLSISGPLLKLATWIWKVWKLRLTSDGRRAVVYQRRVDALEELQEDGADRIAVRREPVATGARQLFDQTLRANF